jgi:hypothetical protein
MRHLDDGLLRRMLDEPLAMTAEGQSHYHGCAECQKRFNAIAAQAQAVGLMLAAPSFAPKPEESLPRMRLLIQAEEAKAPVRWPERLAAAVERRWATARRPVVVAVLAAVVLGAMGATGAAQKLITIFEPQAVVGVPVSPSDSGGAIDPLIFGDLKWTPAPPQVRQVADAAAASQTTGLRVVAPSSLPSGVPNTVSYGVIDHATASFTFDNARAKAEAARRGQKISEMPAGVDGSTLFISAGPGLVQVYGSPAGPGAGITLPILVIGQSRVPVITSTGVTTKQLQGYVLSQPGMPADLVQYVRAIDDPSATLPIPIPRGMATSRQVDVQGVKGLLVDAGIAAGVVWIKDGIIYGVAGQLTPDQVLLIANSLH